MSLFEPSTEARANFTDTSRQAARRAAPKSSTVREAIMSHLMTAPGKPWGVEDVIRRTGLNPDTVKARMNELHETGRVSCLAARGENTNGRSVKVYVVSGHEQGRATQPFRKGVRAAKANEKLDRLRTQIRMLGHVPCC